MDMGIEIESYTLTRDDKEIELYIEGRYDAGEADEPWGRYGATPGTPEEVWIETIYEKLPRYGPYNVANPYRYVLVPWDGKLTESETNAIHDALVKSAHDDIASAAEYDAELRLENKLG